MGPPGFEPGMKKPTTIDRILLYDQVRAVFDKINVKAVHTGRKITYSHLRKFFEQMCNNVLMAHPELRDYIHGSQHWQLRRAEL
ncbi:MAG: hypothetical protein J7K36_06005 [Archaeoglobaceae archaeon]|nr:hypothetical protein [Archaeoglobaceae archaeon]